MAVDSVVKASVTGRVQGVWFRAWTKGEAERLGLRGWVRNETDGSVCALIGGPEAAVQEMIAVLHHGPELARVDRVVTEAASDPLPGTFTILR